jgi:hypothetical protein
MLQKKNKSSFSQDEAAMQTAPVIPARCIGATSVEGVGAKRVCRREEYVRTLFTIAMPVSSFSTWMVAKHGAKPNL